MCVEAHAKRVASLDSLLCSQMRVWKSIRCCESLRALRPGVMSFTLLLYSKSFLCRPAGIKAILLYSVKMTAVFHSSSCVKVKTEQRAP